MSLTDQERRERKTAAQRTRRKRERNEAASWAEEMEPMPEHIQKAIASGAGNIPAESYRERRKRLSKRENAPPYMQDPTSEDGGFDDRAVNKFARAGNRESRDRRKSQAEETHSQLKLRYPHLIGKRNAAKNVDRLERKRLQGIETDDEKIPSIRTLQKIFGKART
jgi:hypothetical protein